MAEIDTATAFKLTPALLEQLGKALIELEAHKDGAAESVSFTEISEHFRDLEAKMTKKFWELEAREKAFKQEESDGRALLAEKEADVAAKEQEMFDRVQVLKDAAVAAIAEARATHLAPSLDTGIETTVSSSLGETNGEEPLGGPGEGEVVSFHQELTKFCERMDSNGLLFFVIENRKNVTVLRDELSHALKCSTEPSRLVLDSLEGFYTNPHDDSNKDIMRQSCINIMEAMNAMLARAGEGADHLLNLEIKHQAKAIADNWRLKLAGGSRDASNGMSLEAEAFLQLLLTFRIAAEFDEDELCKLVFAVAERRQAPELCRALGLAHKMPGVIGELASKGKLISAVHFVHAFELVDQFPIVPLLKTYLKDSRRKSQGKRGHSAISERAQNKGNEKELQALHSVINCVKKYGLEADYPLDNLQRRANQLERAKNDRKRFPNSTKPPHHKKPRPNGGGPYNYRHPAATPLAAGGRRPPAPVYMDRGPYAAAPSEGYRPPHPGFTDPYNYQAAPPPPPGQTAYSQQAYNQVAYAGPPSYGAYTSSGVPPSTYQPYM